MYLNKSAGDSGDYEISDIGIGNDKSSSILGGGETPRLRKVHSPFVDLPNTIGGNFLFQSRKRDLETEQVKAKRRQQESTAKEQQRMKQHSAIQSIEEISQVFTSAVKEGP